MVENLVKGPCHGLTPKYHTAAGSHSLGGTGERIEKVKVREHISWDTNNLIGKAKQTRGFIRHFPWAGRCAAMSRKVRLHHASWLLWKTNGITLNIPPLPSSYLSLYTEHDATQYGISFWSLGPAVSAASPHNSLYTPSLLPGGKIWEAEKVFNLRNHCSN